MFQALGLWHEESLALDSWSISKVWDRAKWQCCFFSLMLQSSCISDLKIKFRFATLPTGTFGNVLCLHRMSVLLQPYVVAHNLRHLPSQHSAFQLKSRLPYLFKAALKSWIGSIGALGKENKWKRDVVPLHRFRRRARINRKFFRVCRQNGWLVAPPLPALEIEIQSRHICSNFAFRRNAVISPELDNLSIICNNSFT